MEHSASSAVGPDGLDLERQYRPTPPDDPFSTRGMRPIGLSGVLDAAHPGVPTMHPSTLVLVELLGAAALLLWGLRMVKGGVSSALGDRLRHWMAIGTRTRASAFATGLGTTVALQSSTATALVAAAFMSREVIAADMAQIVMLGANVGTGLVARLFATGHQGLAPALLLVGVVLHAQGRSGRLRGAAQALVGLGLILLSLDQLALATEPLRRSEVLRTVLVALSGAPVLAALIAAAVTALVSSSLAVVLLFASLAAAGSIDGPLAVALVAGANAGGAIPPVLATRGQGALARRFTLGNLIVRAVGGIAVLPLADPIGTFATGLASGPALLVVDLHLAFNLALAAVALPLTGLLARLVQRIVPDTEKPEDGPRYLDESALDTPAAALGAAARETLRVGDLVEQMLALSMTAFRTNDPALIDEIARLDDRVDRLQNAVKLYLSRLARADLDEASARRSTEIISYAINLEHIGDIVEKGLSELTAKKIKHGLRLSDDGFAEIVGLHRITRENLRLAQSVFIGRDVELARRLFHLKTEIRRMERDSAERHLERLREGRPESLRSSTLHLDVLRDLKRINAHIASVANLILDETGSLRESRLEDGGGKTARPMDPRVLPQASR